MMSLWNNLSNHFDFIYATEQEKRGSAYAWRETADGWTVGLSDSCPKSLPGVLRLTRDSLSASRDTLSASARGLILTMTALKEHQ